ncbi:DUF5818 domain-containing protein [Sphingomicrobium sp. XHP0239]|uniref:DUF5818 domain-containing protein n=1 Tax=Sphingomicrobium maritimum TaxID=3133972 RepID=UPI0031CCBF83
MRINALTVVLAAATAAACAPAEDDVSQGTPQDRDAAGTRPADQPSLVTVEGRISDGVECPIVTTPDGIVYSISLQESDAAVGDYVAIEGEIADASICMQGEGHLIPRSIEAAEPPARDRDPARSGGQPLTFGYLLGPWVARGVDADCARPDFDVSDNGRDMAIIETRVNGVPSTGVINYGPQPRIVFDKPLPELPIETRGPDGLAVMPNADGRGLTLAGKRIEGDGVVFVKCPANANEV